MSIKKTLIELRAIAERLPLSDYGDRCLRDLFVEFLGVVTGEEVTIESLALAPSRAPAPPPELVGVKFAVQGPISAPAGATRDLPRPVADVPDPAGETWLAEQMAADAKAEAEAAAEAAAAKAAPAGKTKTEPKALPPTPNGGH